MSFTSLTYHIVIATFCRKRVIPIELEYKCYSFIYEFLKNRKVFVRRIGGMPDHIHILCDIPPNTAVSDLVKNLKTESSKYMKICEEFPHWEGWSKGYGAFTVDFSRIEVIRQYIMNQKNHHINNVFEEEWRALLREVHANLNIPIPGDDDSIPRHR